MMTEDEAKTKWCPFGRLTTAADGNTYDNRGQSVGFTACIAPDCMAWRWGEDRATGRYGRYLKKLDDGRQTADPREIMEHVGCCGLAGES